MVLRRVGRQCGAAQWPRATAAAVRVRRHLELDDRPRRVSEAKDLPNNHRKGRRKRSGLTTLQAAHRLQRAC